VIQRTSPEVLTKARSSSVHPKGRSNGVSGPFLAGAAGVVLVTRAPDVAFTLPLPGLTVTQDKFDQIMAYVNSTR